MAGFFKLISHFQTQSEPAYCGLATLAMVLNALAIDPCRKWKGIKYSSSSYKLEIYSFCVVYCLLKLTQITGPWRWFDETMLDCCEPLENVRVKGISFGKVICLAHCAGANVEAYRTDQTSIDEFRDCVVACSTSDDCHMISTYSRKSFKQVHFKICFVLFQFQSCYFSCLPLMLFGYALYVNCL